MIFLASELEVEERIVLEAVDTLENNPYKIEKRRKKKRGQYRIIYKPNKKLKIVQGLLNKYFQKNWRVNKNLYAFNPGRSTVLNAKVHLRENSFSNEL